MLPNSHRRIVFTLLLLFVAVDGLAQSEEPLYRQAPNDLVVLNKANASSRLETFPLDAFADRVPPTNVPRGGVLKARLLDGPSGEVEIPYTNIEKIELFEQRLLAAAEEHVKKGEFGSAFDYFSRLDRDYPDYPGFADAFTAALRAEALARFRKGEQDYALALMQSLYERAPESAGLARAVDTIGESIVSDRWDKKDYAGVRRAIDTLNSQFAGLELTIGERWLGRLRDGAEQLRTKAKQLATEGRSREALNILSGALSLDPGSRQTKQLIEQLRANDKTLWVGVWEVASEQAIPRLDTPAARRQSRLIGGQLATLEAYPPEGSEYGSLLGPIEVDPSRRRISIGGGGRSDVAYRLARALLEPAEPNDPLALLRRQVSAVSVSPDEALVIDLKASHPRPESLAKTALPLKVAGAIPGEWRRVATLTGSMASARYERVRPGGSFTAIEEFTYPTPDAAISALRSGEIHLLAEIPPWKLTAVEASPNVAISGSRLPTLHCLLLAPETVLRERRELRRAICYALARKETLDKLVLGGRPVPGGEVLSAPFPRGISLSDPIRYAYNGNVEPRPYEPRLSALLFAAARATDKAALEAAKKQAEAEGGAVSPPRQPPVPNTIVIAHPPTPVARLAVESFGQLLGTINVTTKLVEASEADLASGAVSYDLRYAEIRMAEPLVDSWLLLGPGGISGGCSPPMLAGLQRVQDAKTFGEATDALSDLHRIAFADLPLIPLWQTADQFAYTKNLRGVPEMTVDLYQTVDAWRLDGEEQR